jgi:hypothetical protein
MRLTLLLLLLASMSYAQEFKKFHVGLGVGYSSAQPSPNDPLRGAQGLLIYLKPSYHLNDNISAGFKLEYNLSSPAVASYGINGLYYFSNKNFRPFAGMGFGFYHPMLVGDTFYGYTSRLEETVLGFYPSIGFDWRHLTIAVEWNITPSSKSIINKPVSNISYNGYINSNYLSLKIGLSIGGGRKK